MEPVFIWQMPEEWLMPSAQQERITVRSSTHSERWGSQSETQMPLCPYCFQERLQGREGGPNSPIERTSLAKLSGIGFPAHSLSFGLGSNRSKWLGPPSMKRKITLFARGGKCGALGSKAVAGLAAPAAKRGLSRRSHVRASAPKPAPPRNRK